MYETDGGKEVTLNLGQMTGTDSSSSAEFKIQRIDFSKPQGML